MEFKSIIASQLGNELVYENGTPHNLAAHWIIYDDEQQLTVESENLMQRYLLVLMYYHSTTNRHDSWLSCNPPGIVGRNQNGDPIDDIVVDDDNESNSKTNAKCKVYEAFPKPGKPGVYDCYDIVHEDTTATRWLSNTFECDWHGVICQGGRMVLAIHLSTYCCSLCMTLFFENGQCGI